LKYRFSRKWEITASTYWTAYTDLAVRSREDISNLWWDVYLYHKYIRYFNWMSQPEKDSKHDEYFTERQDFLDRLQLDYWIDYKELKQFDRITLSMDEWSIYFNTENYAEVFKWENAKLLTLLYQPRKIRMDFLIWIQSPNEIHVKFRRLGTDWHYFEKIFFFWRRYISFYVLDPETFRLDPMSIKEVYRETSFNWFSLSWIFKIPPLKWIFKENPFILKYNTDEVVERDYSIYKKWDLFRFLTPISLPKPIPETYIDPENEIIIDGAIFPK